MKAWVIVNLINGKYDLKEIGARIRAEREKKGLSLEELGHRVDVSRQTLSKWERGAESSSPTLPDYLRLCIEFGCDLQYLLCENECSTKDIQGVADYTGLSEKAITSLHRMSKTDGGAELQMLQEIEGLILDRRILQALCNVSQISSMVYSSLQRIDSLIELYNSKLKEPVSTTEAKKDVLHDWETELQFTVLELNNAVFQYARDSLALSYAEEALKAEKIKMSQK